MGKVENKTIKLPQILPASFFERPAEIVARQMLGKWLVRRVGDELIAGQINEVEAYVGPHDLACHARMGKTPRNAVMFGPAGQWYVYFIYGMYWMLNIVTGPIDYPAAVLIRGVGKWNGPGKLTRAMNIDRSLNGLPSDMSSTLWIEDRGPRPRRSQIIVGPRVGIDYSGDWKDKPLRFVLSS